MIYKSNGKNRCFFLEHFSKINDGKTVKVGFEFEFYTDKPYYKLLELLNINLTPAKVLASDEYHSGKKVDEYTFKIEPDGSGGPDMVELITGPMSYQDAKMTLVKCLSFIDKYCFTDDRCSMHINVSVVDDNSSMNDINLLTLILDFDEDFIYKSFPDRRNNIYAQSVKKIIPFKDFESSDAAINVLTSNIKLPTETKFFGINVAGAQRGWLEFRYVGGSNYEKKRQEIVDILEYCINSTIKANKEKFSDEHLVKLRAVLDKYITGYSNYKYFDNFAISHPNITLQVDGVYEYERVQTYYPKMYNYIYNILEGASIDEYGIINYDTQRGRIEFVKFSLSNIQHAIDVDFVSCKIVQSFIEDCNIVNSSVDSTHIKDCIMYATDMVKCKITGSKVKRSSNMTNCYFDDGSIEGSTMDGGVFRSGFVDDDSEITQRTVKNTKKSFWGDNASGNKKNTKK